MAITAAIVPAPATTKSNLESDWAEVLLMGVLTLLAIGVHGYHPYAEDGGLYLAGIKKTLDPSLYPLGGDFVSVHLRFSWFANLVAELVRVMHLQLLPALLLLDVASIWMTLYAVWLIMGQVTRARAGRWGAVLLVALTMTVPVAGTALILMDPYVTARSISTPCGLFALWCALQVVSEGNERRVLLRGKLALGVGCLLVAASVHPLMAAYAFGCVLLLLCGLMQRTRGRNVATLALCGAAVATAACLRMMSPPQSEVYAAVARTRTYWFITEWRWFEVAGLVAPLAVLGWCWRAPSERSKVRRNLVSMTVAAGITAIVVALLFAREDAHSYVVARLQPLRIYQTIYFLMIAALGEQVGKVLLKDVAWRWGAACLLIGGPMMLVQMETFPGSGHLELPWLPGRSPWAQGFEWIRANTPEEAVFAMNADYISMPGEDSQNFRAIAERGTLADTAKDGGIASIAPDLAQRWAQEAAAQKNLDAAFGPERIVRLRALSATWVVLLRTTPTDLGCPYVNERIKVCVLNP